MKPKGKPAGAHSSAYKEILAVSTIKKILTSHELVMPDLRELDRHTNIDGYLELFGRDNIPCGKLEAQVKTLNKKRINIKISYYFKYY